MDENKDGKFTVGSSLKKLTEKLSESVKLRIAEITTKLTAKLIIAEKAFVKTLISNESRIKLAEIEETKTVKLTASEITAIKKLISKNIEGVETIDIKAGTAGIRVAGTGATITALRFLDGDVNGHGLQLGSGGSTVIGSGEAAAQFQSSTSLAASTEQLALVSDNDIKFATNMQNGYSTAKVATLDTSGNLTIPGKLIASGMEGMELLGYMMLGAANKASLPSTSYGVIKTGMLGYAVAENQLYVASVSGTTVAWNAQGSLHMANGSDYFHGSASTSAVNITSVGK